MPRPFAERRVLRSPAAGLYKPAGVPAQDLEEIPLGLDELEALRLADYEGLYQEDAAKRMNISRATFGRIVEAAPEVEVEPLWPLLLESAAVVLEVDAGVVVIAGIVVKPDVSVCDGWQASVNYDYQSAMRWYRDQPIEGYHQLGVRIAQHFKLGANPVVAEWVGANLLGPISDYLPDQSWDRVVFFRLSIAH